MPEIRFSGYRFRPTLWPTLISVPAFFVMVALGVWQLERLEWKTALMAERAARLDAPAITEPATLDPVADTFRRASVAGTFLHDKEMYLAARSMRGNIGYHVVTPLRREAGGHVLVNRGWVPLDRKAPAARQDGQIEGTVTITGIVRGPVDRTMFTPDNDPAANTWFIIDTDAMAAHAGLASVAPWTMDADAAVNPGGFPIGGQTRAILRNGHWQYALTWLLLAVALVVIYVVYHVRRNGEDQ